MEMNKAFIKEMENIITHLDKELDQIQIGRATISMLSDVRVLSYGELSPISHVATVSIPSALQFIISPFDQSQKKAIIEGICKAKPEFNPQDNGNKIIINIPQLTEDKRKEQVKLVAGIAEKFKTKLRNVRRDELENIKKSITSENEQEIAKEFLQKEMDIFTKKIVSICKTKEETLIKI